jgi:hypothetical protein
MIDVSSFSYFFNAPTVNKRVPYSEFFLLQTKGVVVAASLATAEKNGRPFFKIIDAAVVVAYTPLLINDRFCSRTSSLHCRQCCHSFASLSL